MRQKLDLFKAFEKQKADSSEPTAELISGLHGKIALAEGLISNEKLQASPFADAATFARLKRYRLSSKNYANIFLTKAKVLVAILSGLMLEYSKQTAKMLGFFRTIRNQIKKKLQGVALTDEDIHYMNYTKLFLVDFETEVKTRDEELREIIEMLGEADEKSLKPGFLASARSAAQLYLNAVSLLIHRIEKEKLPPAQLSYQFSTPESSPSLLEFYLLISFECLRRFCLEMAVPKIFDIHKRFQDRILHGSKLAEHFYKAYPSIFGHFDPVNFRLSVLIEPSLKRYIKSKIGVEARIILKDEDVKEFFEEKFEFKYPSSNPFWVSFLRVDWKNPKTKESKRFLLTLDVIAR